MKKKKVRQVNSKSLVNIQDLKQRNEKNRCVSLFYTFKNICPNCYTYKNTITRNKQ